MALAPFLVKIPATRAINNVTAMVVAAADEADAIVVANAHSELDRPGHWDLAHVEPLVVGEDAEVLGVCDGEMPLFT